MNLFKSNLIFDFIKLKHITFYISITSILLCIYIIYIFGFNLGIEFTGGMEIKLVYNDLINLEKIKYRLLDNHIYIFKIYKLEQEKLILLKIPNSGIINFNLILEKIEYIFADLYIQNKEYIYPEISKRILYTGIMALILAIIAMLFYITFRFTTIFSVLAFLALIHDLVIMLGIFSFLKIEINTSVISAFFAVIGYSVNDTLIIFNKIKTNFSQIPNFYNDLIINISINQTLSRTIMTSLLTSFTVFSLLVFGGKNLYGFAFAFIIGIFIGTYSSIYIVALNIRKKLI